MSQIARVAESEVESMIRELLSHAHGENGNSYKGLQFNITITAAGNTENEMLDSSGDDVVTTITRYDGFQISSEFSVQVLSDEEFKARIAELKAKF